MSDDPNVGRMVEQYIIVRDGLKVLEDRYDKEREGLVKIREILTGRLLEHMNTTNTTSLKTPFGTASKSVKYTASLPDPDAFMNHVKTTGQFDLLDRRANSTAVREYVAKHNVLPPGSNLTSWEGVNVRIPTTKPE
jgi:hypothetical protein